MNVARHCVLWLGLMLAFCANAALPPVAPPAEDFTLFDGQHAPVLVVEINASPAVRRAAGDLAEDFQRVTGIRAEMASQVPLDAISVIIIGEIGRSEIIGALAAAGKLDTNGIAGAWESHVRQVVDAPLPGVKRALVIAGGDRRGTIFGIYQLSEMIGVSPWYWWADVPVARKKSLALHGDIFKQGPPAVKYRGIFLNDEDWGLRPWAAKTFDPETGNLGPKTYAKVFELLLRLRANHLWPAMHPGTAAFNSFPGNAKLADEYGIVMGSSHCEQMLRNNVSEWDEKKFGDYNFVTNPDGVLKYWEQRVRENGGFENIYTLGMRGIHDGAMPGGGTEREKAARLQTIIAAQRDMLARDVNPDVAAVPQIFCPYKEVLPLYRLMTNLPEDITLVWPDDNYGYIRQFSNEREQKRSGGAGVYYHVSYYGAPRDYLWLCSTPPALIAEEMTKAFDHGANKVWVLNVGDLKPAELDTEFFLNLAWNPHSWNGTNTYEILQKQIARDFGNEHAAEITSILAEYYRLNFQRKPEHMNFPTNNVFTEAEAAQRLADWNRVAARVKSLAAQLPPEIRDAFFELVAYPVEAAALANERALSLATAQAAQEKIRALTDEFNQRVAGGKWRGMMSDNPRKQVDFIPGPPQKDLPMENSEAATTIAPAVNADFTETNGGFVIEAAHASRFVSGADARWRRIDGLGYAGAAVSVFPTTIPIRDTAAEILAQSPRLEFTVQIQTAGDWTVTVRALPTFSLNAGKPPRYAIAFDDAPPQIVSLPAGAGERDKAWQENVLRNAAITSSVHPLTAAGTHTLKIWAVDPGVVLDAIIGHGGKAPALGYIWPPETRIRH